MTPNEKLTKAKESFFQRTERERQLPYDLSVPRYSKWLGNEPIPCGDYRVEYAEGVREEAERLILKDVTLGALRRSLDFALDERRKVLRVRLD
jgi:hypothetical protein